MKVAQSNTVWLKNKWPAVKTFYEGILARDDSCIKISRIKKLLKFSEGALKRIRSIILRKPTQISETNLS